MNVDLHEIFRERIRSYIISHTLDEYKYLLWSDAYVESLIDLWVNAGGKDLGEDIVDYELRKHVLVPPHDY